MEKHTATCSECGVTGEAIRLSKHGEIRDKMPGWNKIRRCVWVLKTKTICDSCMMQNDSIETESATHAVDYEQPYGNGNHMTYAKNPHKIEAR